MAATPEDLFIRHQIQLGQFSQSQIRDMVSVLEESHASIISKLQGRKPISKWQKARLKKLLNEMNKELRFAYNKVGKIMKFDLKQLAKGEALFNADALKELSPLEISVTVVSPDRIFQAASRKPFQGAKMESWFKDLARKEQTGLINEIRQGWLLGETNQQIGARLTGNADTVGLFRNANNSLSTIVRSAVQHHSAEARNATMQANKELLDGVIWTSTLDRRTTIETCMPRDGLKFTVDGEAIDHGFTWENGPGNIHFNCRSVSVPDIKGFKDEGGRLGRNYNKETTSRARSTTRYDADGRRVPNKGERIPGAERRGANQIYNPGTRYEDWLRGQPAWFQDDVLGVSKGALFRKGGLPIEKFSQGNKLLTLDQLATQNPTAWRAAGLQV